MPSYIVRWEIDIEAESPKEAARDARRIQLDKSSTANVFDVSSEDGETVERVDLRNADNGIVGAKELSSLARVLDAANEKLSDLRPDEARFWTTTKQGSDACMKKLQALALGGVEDSPAVITWQEMASLTLLVDQGLMSFLDLNDDEKAEVEAINRDVEAALALARREAL